MTITTTAFAVNGRGCGTRDVGACYLSFGIGPGGKEVEYFLVDPVLPWPGSFQRGFKIIPGSNGVNHVAIFVGESFYASLWTFVEEARRFGISRKVPPTFPFEKLTPGRSMMFFVHSKTYNTRKENYVLDRDPHKPLEGCKFFHDDPEIWAKNNEHFGGGWHPTVRKIDHEKQSTPCTMGHRDLACFFHSDDDIEWAASTENGYPFNIKAPSFSYTGLSPIVPNVLKAEKLEGFGPGVFMKVPLTHIECYKKASPQWENKAKKAGYQVEVLEW